MGGGVVCLMVVFVFSLCNVVIIVLSPFLLVLFFPMISLLLPLVVCNFHQSPCRKLYLLEFGMFVFCCCFVDVAFGFGCILVVLVVGRRYIQLFYRRYWVVAVVYVGIIC